MPILDGWQFMDGFAEVHPFLKKKITIYMTSSSYDDEDYGRAMSTKHITDFLRKPIYRKVLGN